MRKFMKYDFFSFNVFHPESDTLAVIDKPVCQVKSSHLYLYSAFNNTNCNKALHKFKIGKLCQ